MNSLGPKISQMLNAMHSISSGQHLGSMAGRQLGGANMRDVSHVVDQLATRLLTSMLSQSLNLGFQSSGSPFFVPPPVQFVVFTPFDFGAFFTSDHFSSGPQGFKPYKADFESPLPDYRRETSKPEPASKNEPPVQPPSAPTFKEQLEKAGDDLEGLSRQFDTRGSALTEIKNFREASQKLAAASDQAGADEAKAQVEKSLGKLVRKLSLSVHPDKNPAVGSNEPFQKLSDIRANVEKVLKNYTL